MLCYIILLNIHKRIGYIACCRTLTLTADLFSWQGTQPAVLQLFPRYSVDIYKCTNASELISLSRSPCGLQKLWDHSSTCTHSYSYSMKSFSSPIPGNRPVSLINVEVWLVTLTDGSALASNRPCKCMTMLMMSN